MVERKQEVPSQVTIFRSLCEPTAAVRHNSKHGETVMPHTTAEQVVCVRFEVADTGPGIAPSDEASLFSPFRQGNARKVEQAGKTACFFFLQ